MQMLLTELSDSKQRVEQWQLELLDSKQKVDQLESQMTKLQDDNNTLEIQLVSAQVDFRRIICIMLLNVTYKHNYVVHPVVN